MQCPVCRGALHQGVAPFHIDRNGYHLTFDAIPAWLCGDCGEPLFDSEEVNKIQAAIADMDAHSQQLAKAA